MVSGPRPAYTARPGDDCGDHASLYSRAAAEGGEPKDLTTVRGKDFWAYRQLRAQNARRWYLFPCPVYNEETCGGWVGQEGDYCPTCGHVMGRAKKVDS
jgi:hypothetical protein